MQTTRERTWCAGRFWWDCARPTDADVTPLRALVFDLEALTDLDYDVHRVVFNAAFAAHGVPIEWSPARYRRLMVLRDERQRVLAELRNHCVGPECDVLTELLADEICSTKAMMFDEMVLDAGASPRPGLDDLVGDAFAAGVPIGVVTAGRRSWAEPLVRQLVGEGQVETIVTRDDVSEPGVECYQLALRELGVTTDHVLALTGTTAGLRTATATGLATVLVGAECAPRDAVGALAVRADYAGADPLRLATCERLYARSPARRTSTAA
ncbi:HAD family hydrolase [Mycolicibacterium litorale]|uniref:Haloacid dehalogenase n=1 Tax=Mycolicibacterium litorale TaxID=758802 RepID=A0AAD1IKP1_9MYCO|nr:HAD family hydrolase [Mycolicibacterium litorale]MCV7416287.1 HAD hydrolase-like protein [Mycolicibacterium litorale]TDY09540.1 beta-phosphoglucomutase-like phosphatase (HAD superfamily) [Mycolicibacterium litorale]BBY17485.1 haloacid dehalogenase [Mycolicibacterium litorale]